MATGGSIIDSYALNVNDIVVDVSITQKSEEAVPFYNISITNISDTTKIILEKIRDEFVAEETKVASEEASLSDVQEQFKDTNLEEIVVNNAKEPVWVYHRKHVWLRTNILMPS